MPVQNNPPRSASSREISQNVSPRIDSNEKTPGGCLGWATKGYLASMKRTPCPDVFKQSQKCRHEALERTRQGHAPSSAPQRPLAPGRRTPPRLEDRPQPERCGWRRGRGVCSICFLQGVTGAPRVLSARAGRDTRAPWITRRTARQIVSRRFAGLLPFIACQSPSSLLPSGSRLL
jgi:hypothetical protein